MDRSYYKDKTIDLAFLQVDQLRKNYNHGIILHRSGHLPPVVDITDCRIESIDGKLDIHDLDLETFEGIGKRYFKRITGDITISSAMKRNILGFMLIQGDPGLGCIRNLDYYKHPQFEEIWDCLGRHFFKKDLLDFQEELITLGFKDYAKL